MGITAQTTGWLGLGLNAIGSMVGADIFIAWVRSGAQRQRTAAGPRRL